MKYRWNSYHNTLFINPSSISIIMPKQKAATKCKCEETVKIQQTEKIPLDTAITLDKANNIVMAILAKPGAKQNAITDISSEGVGIQINAPAMEGEANAELLKYISRLVGVRKGDVSLEKGFKSRQKSVKILSGTVDIQHVKEKIVNEMKK